MCWRKQPKRVARGERGGERNERGYSSAFVVVVAFLKVGGVVVVVARLGKNAASIVAH